MPPRPANFAFLVKTGFLHVGLADLELLTSGDPSALASQSAGITGMSQHAWPRQPFFLILHDIFQEDRHSFCRRFLILHLSGISSLLYSDYTL